MNAIIDACQILFHHYYWIGVGCGMLFMWLNK